MICALLAPTKQNHGKQQFQKCTLISSIRKTAISPKVLYCLAKDVISLYGVLINLTCLKKNNHFSQSLLICIFLSIPLAVKPCDFKSPYMPALFYSTSVQVGLQKTDNFYIVYFFHILPSHLASPF